MTWLVGGLAGYVLATCVVGWVLHGRVLLSPGWWVGGAVLLAAEVLVLRWIDRREPR